MEEALDEIAVLTGRDDALAMDSNATWPTDDVTGHVTVGLCAVPRLGTGRPLCDVSIRPVVWKQ